MGDIGAVRDVYDQDAAPVSSLIPWMLELIPGLVLLKDGSLMMCFAFDGLDQEGASQVDVDAAAGALEHSLLQLYSGISLWWTVQRRQDFEYPESEFANAAAEQLDRLYRESIESRRLFSNRHYLSMLLRPAKGAEGIFDSVKNHMATGHGAIKSFVLALRQQISGSNQFSQSVQDTMNLAERLENAAGQFVQRNDALELRRLKGPELMSFLHELVNPEGRVQPINLPDQEYLDTSLCESAIHPLDDVIRFDAVGSCYGSVVSVRAWPTGPGEATAPGYLDHVLELPVEMTVSMAFTVVERETAEKWITKYHSYHQSLATSFKKYVLAAVRKDDQPEQDRPQHILAAEQCEEALSELLDNTYGFLNNTIVVYGNTKDVAREGADAVVRALQERRLGAIKERMHKIGAWAGTLPGQLASSYRWHFLKGGNVADLAYIRERAPGDSVNPHLTQVLGKPAPSTSLFATPSGTPYHFNFHIGDLGHTMIIGPTGAGKSVLANFLICQYQRYRPKTIIFDKDYSCQVPTMMLGGSYIDMGNTGAEGIRLAPMRLALDESNDPWLATWIEGLLTSRGYQVTSNDLQAISHAIIDVRSASDTEPPTLSLLGNFLPDRLEEQLAPWTRIHSGPQARYFDNSEESGFSLDNPFTAIEIGRLFENQHVAVAFMKYAFKRLLDSLDGAPTLIYLEEFWFLLEDDYFRSQIRDWLKTFRKKEAVLMLATQSLDDLSESPIATTLIDAIPSRVFLANHDALTHEKLYKKFSLNDEQIMLIRSIRPKEHYYHVQRSKSRLFEARFTPQMLAYLRSDEKARSLFSKYYTSGDSSWREDYIHAITK